MAKYPVRVTLPPAKPAKVAPKPAQNRAAPPVTQSALDRHARMQAEEARSEAMLMRQKAARGAMNTVSVVSRMRETPTKKGK